MDFGKLLHKAQKNEVTKKEPIRYYSTKFEPPKKEQRKRTQLSVNVKKFLEKKEQEEKIKRSEAQKKKEELLALRSKDKKAVKRVSVMLKRTKSANQSVIQDAVDDDNTAVTLAGPAQPDEDDYGYVSQEASAFYTKMMEKYNKMPEEPPKFSLEKKKVSTNLNSTKDRVRAALEKEKEEAMMPHKRKRKHKNPENGDSGVGSDEKQEEVEEEISPPKKVKSDKPRPKAPPPMNFADLLKLAEKKQFEPIVIEKKSKEEENPLTKKQKREMERMRDWQERRGDKSKPPVPNPSSSKEKPPEKDESNRTPKVDTSSKLAKALMKDKVKTPPAPVKPEKLPEKSEFENKQKKIDWGAKHPGAGKMNATTNNNSSSMKTPLSTNSKLSQSSQQSSKMPSIQKQSVNSQKPCPKPAPIYHSNDPKKSLVSHDKPPRPNVESRTSSLAKDVKPDRSKQVVNSAQKENNNRVVTAIKNREFPPKDLQKSRQFPPADVRRKPPSSSSKMKMNKRRIMDDDEDEDSEMDDFIDDGPEDEEDYSKYISEIFGYNKSKYAGYEEDDDDLMESSFAQQMKEEVISTKMGIMEDLEDMKLEEEHKRRKALMKKQLSKKK